MASFLSTAVIRKGFTDYLYMLVSRTLLPFSVRTYDKLEFIFLFLKLEFIFHGGHVTFYKIKKIFLMRTSYDHI